MLTGMPMIEDIAARFPYWMSGALIAVGLYGMIGKRSLVKKLIGMNIFQSAIILFFIAGSLKTGATVPILLLGEEANASAYLNPLPHVLMLTAIVVGIATMALGLALVVRIKESYGSVEDDVVIEKDRAEEESLES